LKRSQESLAINLLRENEPSEGYHLAFSGGKDSVVIKHLADKAGVKYQAFYNVTTIDPPDLIYFIIKYHKDVKFIRPKMPFLKRMVEQGIPPFRQKPWCCREYKEYYTPEGLMIRGIRKEESPKRADRKELEKNTRSTNGSYYIHPILEWASDEVWEYIKKNNIPYCKLYDEGWKRIGCLFCPNATRWRKLHREKYPKYEQAFRLAFRKLIARRKELGRLGKHTDGDEFFEWWVNG